MFFEIQTQPGEWWEFGGNVIDTTTNVAKDITGKTIALVIRDKVDSSGTIVDVDGQVAYVSNGVLGSFISGGRVSRVGTFWGTVTVGTAADGPGWPGKKRFKLVVTDCP